jgi:hypothetical protein
VTYLKILERRLNLNDILATESAMDFRQFQDFIDSDSRRISVLKGLANIITSGIPTKTILTNVILAIAIAKFD